MKCPNCGGRAYYDTVDIGVGEQQIGPAECGNCGWIEPFLVVEDFPTSEVKGEDDEAWATED